jgi:hypothetical protein
MLDCGSNMTMGTSVLCNEFDLWEYLRRVDFQVQTSVAGPQAILGVIDSLKEPLMVILAKGTPAELPLAIGTPQCPLFICQGSPVYTLLYDMHLICDSMGYLDPLRGMYVFRPFSNLRGTRTRAMHCRGICTWQRMMCRLATPR